MEKNVFRTNVQGVESFYLLEENAKVNEVYEPVTIPEEEYKEGLKNHFFIDTESFLKLEVKKIKSGRNGKETEKVKVETKKQNISISTEDILFQMSELQKEMALMKEENLKLQQLKSKKIDFKDAQVLFLRKSKLLNDLDVFEIKKKKLDSIKIDSDASSLQVDGLKLVLTEGYNTDLLKTSNVLIIKEFIDFIKIKIDAKIVDIRQNVETIDFM